MPQDLTSYIHQIEGYVAKVSGIAPKHWKGNYPPDTHHFDEGSIQFAATVDAATQKAGFVFTFTDSGTPHTLECDLVVTAKDANGVPTAFGWAVLLDSVDQGAPTHIAVVPKIGLEGFNIYERLAFEITAPNLPGTEHQIRFDGDVA